MHSYTNKLIHETSPYLLQHAHNPVNWYPWGEEAFNKAIAEDKPVLVSIGYAACHWCHVMERESFESPDVAKLMNEHFVNIKVDREERPDVDHIYMDAVQAISGSGGWPLNVFLTPDRRPFYGGTYYPPQRAYNRSSWTELLGAIADAWKNKRDELLQQAGNLTEHLSASNSFGLAGGTMNGPEGLDDAFSNLMKNADTQWGGFGRAPKFPQTFTINFLLQYAYRAGKQQNAVDSEAIGNPQQLALQQAMLSLDKMINGGIYDQVGGGFARYSTDTEWLVPHFEKMLYDNALLVSTLASAYQLTGKELYKQVIAETLGFIERELMDSSGGFFSALDADSEGEEGRFYVWTKAEISRILGSESEIFCDYFGVSEGGNWNEGGHRGRNILWVQRPLTDFADANALDQKALSDIIESGKQKLLQARAGRVRPQLDDKVLLSWNALMNLAYSHAYAATGDDHYLQVAERNMRFLLTSFRDGHMFHTWKNGAAKHPAFLDDYAFLIAALIELAQVSGRFDWLNTAAQLTTEVLQAFSDGQQVFFYFTSNAQTDIPVRKKEIYDGATPSGNAMMAENLLKLSVLLDKAEWRQRSEKMVEMMGDVPVKYPTSFGVWLSVLQQLIFGFSEVAITGPDAQQNFREILKLYIPNRLMMASVESSRDFPLLAGKGLDGENHIYLCKNYSCRKPVSTVAEFVKLPDL